MLGSSVAAWAIALGVANALPAPQVPGYTDADAPYATETPEPVTNLATTFGPDSAVPFTPTVASGPPLVTSNLTGPTYHGPYSGSPTVTGAVSTTALAQTIPSLGLNPTATYYNANGKLQNPEPVPYQPAGGLGTNGTTPRYMVNSDFDFESIALGLYQEYIELDCFNNGLATFSDEDFQAAGLGPEATCSVRPLPCSAPTTTPTRPSASSSTSTKSSPDLVNLVSWASSLIWTAARSTFSSACPSPLAPYISSCPQNQTRLAWQNFPALHVANQANPNRFSPNDTAPYERVGNRTSDPAISDIPQNASCVNLNVTGYGCGPAISRNRSEPLSFAGKLVNLTWDEPGTAIGPNNSYITAVSPVAGPPAFVLWVGQLNATYTPLTVTGPNTGYTFQPAGEVYEGDPAVNGTMFVGLTDTDQYVTGFNLSNINPHVRALGIYQAG